MSIDNIILMIVIGSMGAVVGFMIALVFVNWFLRKNIDGGYIDAKSNN